MGISFVRAFAIVLSTLVFGASEARRVALIATVINLLWFVAIAWLASVPASAHETGVVGCWDREVTDQRQNRVNICFDPGGKFDRFFVEVGGEADDVAGVWRRHGSRLTFDDEATGKEVCTIKLESSERRFTLSHCSHEGVWNRCGDHDDVTGCLKK